LLARAGDEASEHAMAVRIVEMCHGEQGRSGNPDVPSLGAQPAFYLTVQLIMFRENIRPIEPMTEMSRGTNDADRRDMADFADLAAFLARAK